MTKKKKNIDRLSLNPIMVPRFNANQIKVNPKVLSTNSGIPKPTRRFVVERSGRVIVEH